MASKVMINIFGSPTSGKTTILELLQKHIDRLCTVDYDVVKSQISYYTGKRDGDVARVIAYDLLASASKTGLDIVVLLPKPEEQEGYERIAKAARINGYRLINIELFAPEDVLVKRYKERLLNITDPDVKQRVKTLDEFIIYIRTPYFRPDDAITFDTSEKKSDVIFKDILRLIER